MGAHGWLKDSGSRRGVEGGGVCLRLEAPQWELLQRGLFAFLSGSGIEFHYHIMELSLLHIPHPSPGGGPGTSPGMCLQVGGRRAGQASGWSGEAGTAKDTSWL